jgi:hypothetical protein
MLNRIDRNSSPARRPGWEGGAQLGVLLWCFGSTSSLGSCWRETPFVLREPPAGASDRRWRAAMGGSSIRTSDRQMGGKEDDGGQAMAGLGCGNEWMGLLSTVNGRRRGEPRPGYYLFVPPGRWARELDSTTSWVGTPPAMRCRREWGAEECRDLVYPHSSIRVWSVEAARATNGVVVPIEPWILPSWAVAGDAPPSRDFALPHAVR